MIENFHHPRNRRKQTVLDHGRALFLGQVQISQDEGDMIGELDAGLDAAGLHSLLQLHQEKTAPGIIAKYVIPEIQRAVGAQIEGVGVRLLELTEVLWSNCGAKLHDLY